MTGGWVRREQYRPGMGQPNVDAVRRRGSGSPPGADAIPTLRLGKLQTQVSSVQHNVIRKVTNSLIPISVVIPNFNGGNTIGATLQSLVDQAYPPLEIIVVDGGSTDNSVDVIRKFAPHLTWWVSEKDRGQSHAINKGFAHCTGEIVNWLGSDDCLLPGAFQRVGQYFAEYPDTDVLAGQGRVQYASQESDVRGWGPRDLGAIDLMPCHNPVFQPSCFYRRRLLDRLNPLDESYHLAMDFELWMYFKSRGAQWRVIKDELSVFAMTGTNKSSAMKRQMMQESERVYRAYSQEAISLAFWYRHMRHPLLRSRKRYRGRGWGRLAAILLGTVDWSLTPFYGYWRVRVMDWTPLDP